MKKLNKNEIEMLRKIIGEAKNKRFADKEQGELDYEYLSENEKVEMFSDMAVEITTLTLIEYKLSDNN